MGKKLSTGAIVLISVGAFILLSVFWFIGAYNGLIKADANVDESWANVETQYQRRADLIPNLINTVTGARDFEANTQAEIARLRTQATQIKQDVAKGLNPGQLNQIDTRMTSVLSGLNIVVEAYPDLKATENFLALQSQLEGTENRVSVARTRYNEKVKIFNVKIRKFPTVIIANMFGYEKEDFFESKPGTEDVPVVDFG